MSENKRRRSSSTGFWGRIRQSARHIENEAKEGARRVEHSAAEGARRVQHDAQERVRNMTPKQKNGWKKAGRIIGTLLLVFVLTASIFAGIFGEAYHHKDIHSKIGVLCSFLPALLLIFVVGDPFRGLILSQMVLSIQLPITIFTQVYLTSSKKVMGEFANSRLTNIVLLILGTIVSLLNLFLLAQLVIG